jgi:hypothetical protein
MGQHDTSSLGGIIYNPRLLGKLPVEGPNVLRQSGNYQGTEDADADAMKQLAVRILRAEPNSAEQAELLDQFDQLRREEPLGSSDVKARRKLEKERIFSDLQGALAERGYPHGVRTPVVISASTRGPASALPRFVQRSFSRRINP